MAKTPSTQDFLEFDQIRDGIIILKNKSLRMVLMVSSINLALKSDEEREAILFQFQDFLNSLDFPCQILIQSRRLNITGYLDGLKEIEKKETNELLKAQIEEYRNFIKELLGGGQIMQKTFYVIVPFFLSEVKMLKKQKFSKHFNLTEELFQRAKTQLLQRVEFVSLGLRSCGLQSVPLNTLELVELFWTLNHQAEAEHGYYPEFPPELTK